MPSTSPAIDPKPDPTPEPRPDPDPAPDPDLPPIIAAKSAIPPPSVGGIKRVVDSNRVDIKKAIRVDRTKAAPDARAIMWR